MNTNHVCPINPRSKPLPVRLDPFPLDERAVYIDSICAVLIDSRFGPGRSIQRFEVHYSDYSELELDILCDLTNKDLFLSFMASPAAKANAIRRRVRNPHVGKGPSSEASIHDQTLSPSTLARGSP